MNNNEFVLSREVAYNKMHRMAYEILETNFNEQKLVLAGIQKSGVIIAGIIQDFLKDIFEGEIEIVEIDIDKKNPRNIRLSVDRDFTDEVIIVVDDVSNSGRTLLYALKPFLNFYPKKIQTLVLVERSYQQFPVSPDFVGMSIATALSQKIVVETHEDKVEGARVE